MMRYFTKELWMRINACDERIRNQAEKVWNANSMRYQQQFIKVKKYLPQGFVKNYLSRNELHDYIIVSIAITKRDQIYSCELQLTNGIETVIIAMAGIKVLHIDIESFSCCVQGKLAWGYSEFEITPDNNIKLAVLFDMQNEMQVEFETIKLNKTD